MRRFVIFGFIVLLGVGTIGGFINSHKLHNEYPMTMIVYNISDATDTVTLKDFNGNLWQFKGVSDWAINDICSCIMDNRGTALIKDDKIVKVQYSGYLEGWQ